MGDKRVNFGFTALEGNLYAIGGWNGETILQSCEKYYPDRDEWVEIAELPYPLCLMQVGVLCGKLYVVGGFQGLPGGLGADVTVDLTSTEGWTATILSFDPQVGGWHQEDISLREARSDHAMVIHDGRLLVLGGYNGVDRLSCVESFGVGDTETRVEHHLQLPMPARNFAASMLQVE
jgi:N-acetylneuraminic acid mutarotase